MTYAEKLRDYWETQGRWVKFAQSNPEFRPMVDAIVGPQEWKDLP